MIKFYLIRASAMSLELSKIHLLKNNKIGSPIPRHIRKHTTTHLKKGRRQNNRCKKYLLLREICRHLKTKSYLTSLTFTHEMSPVESSQPMLWPASLVSLPWVLWCFGMAILHVDLRCDQDNHDPESFSSLPYVDLR